MVASSPRRLAAWAFTKMASPRAADLMAMFAQRNPTSTPGDVNEVGKLAAASTASAAKLSASARKRLIARTTQFDKLVAAIADEPTRLQSL
jgi:hypothetical protein